MLKMTVSDWHSSVFRQDLDKLTGVCSSPGICRFYQVSQPQSDTSTCGTYHSQLAWRTFCFRTFPFTLSRLKLSSGLGTMRYIAPCSSTREEEEERGKGGTQEREGKEKRKQQKRFNKTTKDRWAGENRMKTQKWIITNILRLTEDGMKQSNNTQNTVHICCSPQDHEHLFITY